MYVDLIIKYQLCYVLHFDFVIRVFNSIFVFLFSYDNMFILAGYVYICLDNLTINCQIDKNI